MNIETLFEEALSLPAPERAGFLAEACEGRNDLRAELEALIAAYDRPEHVLDKSPLAQTLQIDPLFALAAPGECIAGRYSLIEPIGEGGMGTVWMAEQSEPVRRMVALKLIKPGMDSKQVLARFEAERQALAMMDHPNIARVFDGGTTDQGRPFFVMELVRGIPITEFCDRERLTVERRLDLFATVCRAVQHAHQKGIIHRDLKPTNILVTVIDGEPVPKVIDFGVAKAVGEALTDRTLHTGFHQLVGTPLYMSPEQAELAGVDVDTRSDIYSLGVLLYELLTGTTPFDSQTLKEAAFDEMRRMIREDEPLRPSLRLSSLGDTRTTMADARRSEPKRLSWKLKGELDWIVMKALEKAPGNRYPTADALAADVVRFRSHQPVEARPPSLAYVVRKLARRNRVALTTASLVLLAMLAGTGVSIWQAVRATRAEKRTAAALDVAKAESERAEQQRELAEEQRKLASEQFEIARGAVDAMYTEAAEKWLSQGDRPSPVQQEFLNRALSFYQRFATAPGRDPEARHKALHALARVGEIQTTLGRLDLAERAYAESLVFARDLAAEVPDRSEFRRDETQAHEAFGNVLLARGKTAEAEPVLRAGLKLQEAVVATDPTPENRLSLVSLLTEFGHLLEHTRRLEEAEAVHRRGLGILEDLATTHADKDIYRTTLANNQSALGRLLRQSGRLAEADQAYRRCLAVIEPRVRSRMKDPDSQKALATMLMGWGLVQWELDQLDKAEETMRRAIAVDESLMADFPTTPGYRVRLAEALAELADLLDDLGQPDEADQAFDRMRSVWSDLIALSPDFSTYRNDLAVLERRRRISKGVARATVAFEGFVETIAPFLRRRPMLSMNTILMQRGLKRTARMRARRLALENLEMRQVLSAAQLDLSSLLPANGGNGSAGFVVDGIVAGGKFGQPRFNYEHVGDVNGDGIEDLLVAAPGIVSSGTGLSTASDAYLIFGKAGGFPASLDLTSLDGTNGYVIHDALIGEGIGGIGGGAGDLNHDGFADIVLGAPVASPSPDRLRAGQTFVLYGGLSHLTAIDQADGTRDGTIQILSVEGNHGFVINGEAANDGAGRSIGIDDINGDSIDDLLVVKRGAVARAYVIFGRNSQVGDSFPATLELATITGAKGFVIPGLSTNPSGFGNAASAGDVNGDGIGDLVLGDYLAAPGGRSNAGQTYVIFGRPSFPASFNLATLNGSNGFTVNGAVAGDFLGYSVDGAGDVNGDGIDDVLIGATTASNSAGARSGAAYVILGKRSAFPSVIEISTFNGSNGFALYGVAASDSTGGPVGGAGDVNGDGLDDLIIGAANADPNGVTDAGRSYVVYGRRNHAAGFNLSTLIAANGGDGAAGFVIDGFQTTQNTRPAGIGDINGDGFADIRVGAETDDPNGLTDAGRAYIVYGKPSSAPSTKFYVVNDGTTDATFEYSALGTPGDSYTIAAGNTASRGAASTAAGDKVWVVDANKNVYIYNAAGALLGSWVAGSLPSNATVEGIATNGTDVWLVDSRGDKVYRYTGAASRLAGSQNAASSFALNSGNAGPKDIVTDGTSLWVVNDSTTDKVFEYNLTGSLLGSWTISGAGSSPTGLTIDPVSGGDLWIVDSGTDRVYRFASGRSAVSGTLSPAESFALAAGNSNPQGIADPPVTGSGNATVRIPISKPRAASRPDTVIGRRAWNAWNQADPHGNESAPVSRLARRPARKSR